MDPDEAGVRTTAARPAGEAGDPVDSLQDDLRAHLEACRDELLERVHRELWEPLRRSADRLGALRDEALAAEDSLRDAGRAVRMLCDELEERDPSATLRAALSGHLDAVAEFAHKVPRMMEITGRPDGDRVVPSRDAVRAVVEADYPQLLREAMDTGELVLAPARVVPPSPADLLRPEDHARRLTDAVDRAQRHFRLALEEAADGAAREVGSLLRRGRTLDRLRLRWRRSRAPARRGSVESSLVEVLDRAAADLDELLEARRFAADLARRERALTEAAEEAAGLLEEAAGAADGMRELADRVERAGRSVAGEEEGEGPAADAGGRRLERLEAGVREALEGVRARLPVTDRPEGELTRAMGRFVRLSEALSGLGADDEPERTAAARRPAVLRDRVGRAVPRVRRAVREAGEIVSHGLRAARSEAAVREPDAETVSALVRESSERAARRLREAADLLEEALSGAASQVREVPDRILAELRSRCGPGGGRDRPVGWRRLVRALAPGARRAARRLRAWWRRLAGGPEGDGSGAAEAAPRRTAPERSPRGHPRRDRGDPAREARGGEAGGGGARGGETDREEPEGFDALPPICRWLFRPEPLDDPHLLVGREREVERLRTLRGRWERGEEAALAVVGRPGAGKTSLLNCGVAELEAGVPVHRGRIDRRMTGAREAAAWLGGFFGLDEEPRTPEELAGALEGRRELVLLENGERLFRREVDGYRAVRALGRTVEATAGEIAWVVTFELEPWRVLRSVTGIEGRFTGVAELGPLDRRELEEALLARHRLTGYDLRFPGGGDEARRAWFDRLRELSGGVPGRALQIWRESLAVAGPHEIRALPPRSPCPGRVGGLDRETLFLLAALLQHGDLREEALPRLLHAPAEEVCERLAWLRREGLVARVPGLPPRAPLQVDRCAFAEVEDRLRTSGLLAPAPGEDAT